MSAAQPESAPPPPPEHGFFRALVEHTSDVLLVLAADGRVRYVSPSATRLLGYPPAAFLGHSAFDFVHPDDAAAAHSTFAQDRQRAGVQQPVQFRLRRQDGAWRWFEVVANNRLHDPAVRGLVVSARDVTRRVEAEAALQAQAAALRQAAAAQARLAAIVESADDAIIAKDRDGRVVAWNPGAERLYGFTAEEMVGQSLAVVIPPERREELAGLVERLRRGERVQAFETVRVRKDGQRLDVSVSLSPIRGEDGQVVGAALIKRDITERKRIERERAELYRALRDRERQLHELMEQLLPEREAGRGASDPKLSRLSRREREVLTLLAEGKTNREIGQALGCTTLTARNHVDHVLRKLELADRTQAAVWAVRRGLIGPLG